MKYWLLKTEPDSYSYSDLVREGHTIWDGVSNNWALQNIRLMRQGDLALIYHSGKERAVAGIGEIVSAPYQDPRLNDEKRVVVDIRPVRGFSGKVTLRDIKADPAFRDFMLVRFTRLSVMPVEPVIWERILRMAR
jgi:predicted RNA-binding protein with PUA-like domain